MEPGLFLPDRVEIILEKIIVVIARPRLERMNLDAAPVFEVWAALLPSLESEFELVFGAKSLLPRQELDRPAKGIVRFLVVFAGLHFVGLVVLRQRLAALFSSLGVFLSDPCLQRYRVLQTEYL
ncbi:MAG TPA: hypothetical protein VFE62_22680, partial [Gemmataceae bacterium]|nr:hypothetical protein [Gemmataceae bacterium]